MRNGGGGDFLFRYKHVGRGTKDVRRPVAGTHGGQGRATGDIKIRLDFRFWREPPNRRCGNPTEHSVAARESRNTFAYRFSLFSPAQCHLRLVLFQATRARETRGGGVNAIHRGNARAVLVRACARPPAVRVFQRISDAATGGRGARGGCWVRKRKRRMSRGTNGRVGDFTRVK